VIHLPLNVNEGEGETLRETYKVGYTYPVFILTNSEGKPINRWVGYTGGAKVLVNILKNALSDLTLVDERVARYKTNQTLDDALFLAGYFSSIGENLKAVDYYRSTLELGKKSGFDYSYKIFENIANAVWNGDLEFAEAIPAADAVLNSPKKTKKNIIDVARLMTRLAVKANQLDKLDKYLRAGISASAGKEDSYAYNANYDLRADYAIYLDKDIKRGLSIKKSGLPLGWESDRDQFYMFAKWCLLRKVNLDEAEMYARKTLTQVQPGTYRARAYNTLAEILEADNKIDEAIEARKAAVEQDPDNAYYKTELDRLLGE